MDVSLVIMIMQGTAVVICLDSPGVMNSRLFSLCWCFDMTVQTDLPGSPFPVQKKSINLCVYYHVYEKYIYENLCYSSMRKLLK